MDHPILLVGDAPNARGHSRGLPLALACKAVGVGLRRCAPGVVSDGYPDLYGFVQRTRHVNLLHEYPGRKQRGSAFPEADAQEAADEIAAYLSGGLVPVTAHSALPCRPRVVLLAGHRVEAAFGYRKRPFFDEHAPIDGVEAQVFVVPHPSGLSRYWNDQRHRHRARAFFEGLAREAEAVELAQ